MHDDTRNPLDGTIARLNRAEDHLQAVVNGVNGFLAGGFGTGRTERDRQGRVSIRVAEARRPGDDISLAIGEYVYNVRSALDHVAYQLAALHTGTPLPKRVAEGSAFLIARSGPEFRRLAPRRLGGVSPQARAAIERLQPYHRKRMPDAWTLALLNDLSNVDKHRMLHPTASMQVGSQFGIQGTGFFELHSVEVFPNEIRAGAMLARFTGRFDGDVSFTHNMALDVVFGRESAAPRARGESVVGSLVAIRDYLVGQVMPAIAPFFGSEFDVTEAGEEMPPS